VKKSDSTPKKTRITRRRLLLGGGALAVTVGGVAAYRILRSPDIVYSGPVTSLDQLRSTKPYDVCIIGSGPAGAALGNDLARKGVQTLIIESGGNIQDTMSDDRYRELDVFRNSGDIDYPLSVTRMRALGGTSNVWTGRCSRLHPIDFEVNSYTPEGIEWPLSYAQFEPYYQRAEQTLRVRGGNLSSYHAPRQSALPLPSDLDISGLKAMMHEVGVTIDDSPTSTSPSGSGPIRVASDLLPGFSRQSNADLAPGLTVTRLISIDSGDISGAEVKDMDRGTHVVRARIFIVACGAVASARLLLLSKSKNFPYGIGNIHDNVGRFFNAHPNVTFSGKISHDWNTILPKYELGRCHQYYESLKKEGYGSALLVFSQSWMYRNELQEIRDGEIAEGARKLVGRLVRANLRIGATLEMYPQSSNRISLVDDQKDYFGNAIANVSLSWAEQDLATLQKTRSLIRNIYQQIEATDVSESNLSWSGHHIGTCRMGDNPRTSVVNADLQVHDCPNLYVLGSGNFVTGGASHPTLAIVALAHRLSEHLLTELPHSTVPESAPTAA